LESPTSAQRSPSARARRQQYPLIDNFSWKLDRHDLKFGYEFRRTTVDQFFDAGYRGRLDFGSLEDFLSGTLSGGRAARGNSNRITFQNSHAGYLQDTFRWRPSLRSTSGCAGTTSASSTRRTTC
jgi:outer membrane receptor protein involved in Fe transport